VLGVYADPKLTDVVADVSADDLVVFYTDGVTEGRGDEGFYGEQRLERLLADCVGWEPEQVASRVIDALLGFQRGRPRDDMAVVVLGG
jgi:sigma-B regulation protein RsbU (phosphoserine phosphatase)